MIRHDVHSEQADCALNVVFHDADSNNPLDFASSGRVADVAQLEWIGRHPWARPRHG